MSNVEESLEKIKISFWGAGSAEASLDTQSIVSGQMKPTNTGRCIQFEFEPSWFPDLDMEAFYDKNWEIINEKIKLAYENLSTES